MEFEKELREKIALLGYELVCVNSKTEKGEHILSIVIDRVEPIDMDAIVDASHKINEIIDEINPYDHPYTLDISSLGAEKPLKVEQLGDYKGRYVHVHLINPIDGENIYEGTLESVNDGSITLSYRVKTKTKVVDITKENISKIRLAIKF